MIGFLLFVVAYLLFWPLSLINIFFVDNKKGYFKSSAKNLDIYANREFRSLWNKALRTESGYEFGKISETISSALGKNEINNTLSKNGKSLVKVLGFLDKDHCKNSIDLDIN